MAESGDPHFHPPVIEELKAEARPRGLWNLFLPHATEWTDGLSNLDYAPLAEIIGRSPRSRSEALNCSAPDTGNMEILTMFGTAEQKERWLQPAARGRDPLVLRHDRAGRGLERRHQHRSCSIRRDGDDYVINGRKWWISGAASHRCKVAHRHGQDRSRRGPRTGSSRWCWCPMDTPGVTIVRDLPVFGYNDREGHCELLFDDVRVPAIEPARRGGRRLRHRPGPARPRPHPPLHALHRHGRAGPRADVPARAQRVAFGKTLAEQGVIQEWIADSRIEIEQARLLTLKAAWLMDTVGNKGARIEISAIKVVAPNMALRVVDRAIQAHGGGGVSATTSRWPPCTPGCARCASPTVPTRCTGCSWPAASCASTSRARPSTSPPGYSP